MVYIKKIILLSFIVLSLLISCKDNQIDNQIDNQNISYYIDLSIKQKKAVSSFKIEPNGKGIVLINELTGTQSIYQVQFDKNEMHNIIKNLNKLSLRKCDTISKTYNDGLRYIMLIKDNKGNKTTLVSGTCEQLKPLDDLVLYIKKIYDKKEKALFYESLKLITPPPFPKNFQIDKNDKN